MFFRDIYIKVFYIFVDFDDIFVNIGLGLLLKENLKFFLKFYKFWIKRNFNLNLVFIVLKKYVYR